MSDNSNCLLNSGIPLGCRNTIAGIKKVYAANYTGSTTFSEDTTQVVTGITTNETFYEFDFRKQSSTWNQEGGHENGNMWTQNVTMAFLKQETSKRNALLLLAKADTHLIVLDQNDSYWIIGRKNGATLTASNADAGTAFGDWNGYNITMTGIEPELANEVSSACFATLTTSA